jgi:hypothetical protein
MLTKPTVEQIVIDVPATAVASVTNVNVLVEISLGQPEFEAVRVRVTLPAVKSLALGVYVQVVNELALAKVPVPLEVQVILVWLVALEPVVILIAPIEEQTLKSAPATAVIGLLMVNVFVEVEFGQGAFPFVVNVKMTLPTVISSALGE